MYLRVSIILFSHRDDHFFPIFRQVKYIRIFFFLAGLRFGHFCLGNKQFFEKTPKMTSTIWLPDSVARARDISHFVGMKRRPLISGAGVKQDQHANLHAICLPNQYFEKRR